MGRLKTTSNPNVLKLRVQDDEFVHFTSKRRAEDILKSGKILMKPPYAKFGPDAVYAVSLTFGRAIPGVQTSHAQKYADEEGGLVAIVFKTNTRPDFGQSEEVGWKQNVNIHSARIVPASSGLDMVRNSPDTVKDDSYPGQRVVYESETVDGAEGTRAFKSAVAIILDVEHRFLVGLARAEDERNGKWCFPGGGIDPEDGADPVAAAVREGYEETTLEITSAGHVITHPERPGVAFVVCRYLSGTPTPNAEFQEFQWVPYEARHKFPDLLSINRQVLEQVPQGLFEWKYIGRRGPVLTMTEMGYLTPVPGWALHPEPDDWEEDLKEWEELSSEALTLMESKLHSEANMELWENRLSVIAGKSWEKVLRESLLEEFPPKKPDDKSRKMATGSAAPAPEGTKPGTAMKDPDAGAPEKASDPSLSKSEKDGLAKKTLSDPAEPQSVDQSKDELAQDDEKDAGGGAPGAAPGAAPKGSDPQAAAQAFAQKPAGPGIPAPTAMPDPKTAPGQAAPPPGQAPAATMAPKGAPVQQNPAAAGMPPQAGSAPPGQPPVAPQKPPIPGAQGKPQVPGQGAPGAPPVPGQTPPAAKAPGAPGQPPAPAQGTPQAPGAPGQPPAPAQGQAPGVPGQPPAQGQAPAAMQAQAQQGVPADPAAAAAQGQAPIPGQGQADPNMAPGAQAPGMPGQPQVPGQAMPQGAKTIQLVLRDEMEAQRAVEWLKAMGLGNTQVNGNRLLTFAATPEDMTIVTRTAAAFNLEMSNQLS